MAPDNGQTGLPPNGNEVGVETFDEYGVAPFSDEFKDSVEEQEREEDGACSEVGVEANDEEPPLE